MKKALRLALTGILLAMLALGTGAQTKKLTLAINWLPTEELNKAFQGIAADFMKQNPSIQIDVVFLPDYENTMKTKMAANDLPDLWSTHGWSVGRYSEYLQPLNDQAWVSKISPTIKPVVFDAAGKVYVLPVDMEVAGVTFNRDVLDQAGVDPFKIKTWDDFKAACAKVKKIGKTPVQIGGNPSPQDNWMVGNFYDWTAPSFLITNDKKNFRKELKDGSFDWKNWESVAKLLVDFRDAGYLNPDYTQGTWPDVGKKLGMGDAAFGMFGNYVIAEAKKYNPKGRFGFIPVPAASKDDSPALITGERVAIGVWKDSKYKAEALKFLAFCASPEFVSKIATITANPPGLVGPGYKGNAGDLQPYVDKIAGVRGFPYFDRAYLPSGMWDSMYNTGLGLLSNSMKMDEVIAKMKGDYEALMSK